MVTTPGGPGGPRVPFGKNTIAGFTDARCSLQQVTRALDALAKP